jgi:hypothetical protein
MCTTGRRPSAHKLGQELGLLGPDVAPQQQRRATKQTREQRLKTLALERTRRRAKGGAPTAGAPRRSRRMMYYMAAGAAGPILTSSGSSPAAAPQ